MDISVRHMEVLRAVLSHGGMTAAAAHLGLTQPAVSRIIQQIERQLGVKLFVKDGRNIAPTPEARELGQRIDEVFDKVDVVRRLGRILKNGGGRRIRIAVTPPLASSFLPGPLARTRARFPDTVMVVKMREMGSVETPTIDKDFDISIAYNITRSLDVVTHTLCNAPIVCYVPSGHPLAARIELRPEDLAEVELMSFNIGSRLGVPLEEAFQAAGLKWRPALQTGNSFMGAPLARVGAGIAIADPFIWNRAPLDGVEMRLFRPLSMLTPQVFYRREHAVSAPEAFLIKELLAEAKAWSFAFAEFMRIAPEGQLQAAE
ncbi:MAG: LysR family transcriptional regulator [Beijerinckiaceae bacterium]